MVNYIKPLYHILKNYRFYSIYVIFYEIYFNIKYDKKFNQFKYLKSNIFSDSIPCYFFFLHKTYQSTIQVDPNIYFSLCSTNYVFYI